MAFVYVYALRLKVTISMNNIIGSTSSDYKFSIPGKPFFPQHASSNKLYVVCIEKKFVIQTLIFFPGQCMSVLK